jgi:hypothetical protein
MPARLNITDEERKERHKQALKKHYLNKPHIDQNKYRLYPTGTGIVYKIYSQNSDKIYIGSTTYKASHRLASHKSVKNKTRSKEVIDLGEPQIMILETVVFGDCKQTLRDREYYYINSLSNVVNKSKQTINLVTGKYEYGDKFGPEYYKTYYNENRETYLENQRERRGNGKVMPLRREFQRLSAIQI